MHERLTIFFSTELNGTNPTNETKTDRKLDKEKNKVNNVTQKKFLLYEDNIKGKGVTEKRTNKFMGDLCSRKLYLQNIVRKYKSIERFHQF